MFHTVLLHPLAQTPLLKKYQKTSSRTHETSHDQCTCTTSAAGSVASKQTIGTHWHHQEISGVNSVRENKSWIKPLVSQSQLWFLALAALCNSLLQIFEYHSVRKQSFSMHEISTFKQPLKASRAACRWRTATKQATWLMDYFSSSVSASLIVQSCNVRNNRTCSTQSCCIH